MLETGPLDDVGVQRQHVLRAHRQLELAGGVLGVELLHGDALLPQGFQQVPAKVRLLDEAGHPIGGAADCGLEVAAGVAS